MVFRFGFRGDIRGEQRRPTELRTRIERRSKMISKCTHADLLTSRGAHLEVVDSLRVPLTTMAPVRDPRGRQICADKMTSG